MKLIKNNKIILNSIQVLFEDEISHPERVTLIFLTKLNPHGLSDSLE